MNFYTTLGVAPEASPADIKRAYRRLAMAWHPDRNDDPGATERFKQIRAAYDALLVRAEAPVEAPAEAAPPAPEAVARAADIRLVLEITLVEASTGCDKILHYQRGRACPTCDGSGEHGISRTRFCQACHGSGRVRDNKQGLVSCTACVGRGFFSERICPDCHGSGRETADVNLHVKVPPGMLPGDDLRLAGQGEPGDGTLQAGDLFLSIVIHPHPLFHRQGRDLYLDMPVNALALIAGSAINVPLPVGTLVLPLEPGMAEVRELRLAGKGYPGRGKAAAGDLWLTLRPVFPQHLTGKQRKLLLQAVEAVNGAADDCLPAVAAWWRAARAGGAAGN